MTSDARDPRPLSPHLQVWRWHATMLTSILHRATGAGLYGGAMLLTLWLFALASGPEAFAAVEGLFLSPFGMLVLFAFTLAITFHLFNGLRYLFWDSGVGFTPRVASRVSVVILIASAGASVLIWTCAFAIASARIGG